MSPDECRVRRQALGLTPVRLAAMAGLTERTVLRYEAAAVAPRTGTVLALRRALRNAELSSEARLAG